MLDTVLHGAKLTIGQRARLDNVFDFIEQQVLTAVCAARAHTFMKVLLVDSTDSVAMHCRSLYVMSRRHCRAVAGRGGASRLLEWSHLAEPGA